MRIIDYQTSIIQSNHMEIRVSVEIRRKHIVSSDEDPYERTGNWYSCVTDLDGNILGGQTSGSGDTTTPPLQFAFSILKKRLKKGKLP